VQQALHAVLPACRDDLARQLDVIALERLAARLVQDAPEIDDGIDRRDQARQHARIVHVRVDDVHRGKQDQLFLTRSRRRVGTRTNTPRRRERWTT
jgi:hypothetical protein